MNSKHRLLEIRKCLAYQFLLSSFFPQMLGTKLQNQSQVIEKRHVIETYMMKHLNSWILYLTVSQLENQHMLEPAFES